MSLPIIQPVTQYFNRAGIPLEAGYIYIGEADSDPETDPIDVFWDAAGLVPAAQPIRTIAGYPSRAGAPAPIFVNVTEYSVRWTERDGNLVAYLESVPVPIVTASEFGISLIQSEDAEEARGILELVIGTDVQAFSSEIATVAATEVEMRAGVEPDLRSMSPELIADAIDELGMKVRVSADDSAPGYLQGKIASTSSSLTISTTNPGADETLSFTVAGTIVRENVVSVNGETTVDIDVSAGISGFDLALLSIGDMGDDVYIRLGTDSGIITTDYISNRTDFPSSTTTASAIGFRLGGNGAAVGNHSGVLSFRKVSTAQWVMSGNTAINNEVTGAMAIHAGRVYLDGELTTVRIFIDTSFVSGSFSYTYW